MERAHFLSRIGRQQASHPIVAILGPRQCGKTTLAREYAKIYQKKKRQPVFFFDLENPTDLARLENPMLALGDLKGLVVIDEIQRRPDLFPVLRVLADQPRNPRQFLILGSASKDLLQQSSESLAGRISYMELTPFSLSEVAKTKRLWLRGGFPRSYLAPSLTQSIDWRTSYISTYLESDIPALGLQIPAMALRRFWMMLTHFHGQIFNASEIARSLGVADTTARRYLDILSGTFMVRQLPPWSQNIGKRQVKSPKIYFRDSGIFHSLCGIRGWNSLQTHPRLGASWEGFALESAIRLSGALPGEFYFWATHNEAELDLLLLRGTRRIGLEFKYSDHPKLTPSMRIAMQDLKLDELIVVYPGAETFPIAQGIQVVGLSSLVSYFKKFPT
jgi:uncharacterized protein